MTCMPASRKARATTLMPRSWPSRPTLARTMRRAVFVAVMQEILEACLPLRGAVVAAEHIGQGIHDLADGTAVAGSVDENGHEVLAGGGSAANGVELPLDGLAAALLL